MKALFFLLFLLSMNLPAHAEKPFDRMLEKVTKDGDIRIIIDIRDNNVFRQLNRLSSSRMTKSLIVEKQDDLLAQLNLYKPETVQRLENLPFMTMDVDRDTLLGIRSLVGEEAIIEDLLLAPNLAQSTSLTGADFLNQNGVSGHGQAIAIIDTGVDTSHDFFQGRVIVEACFSTTRASNNSTSLCPNGLASEFGEGSANDCSSNIAGCGHGTHVAGIAAGNGLLSAGVANSADIISLQTFSRFDNTSLCNSFGSVPPCTLSYTADQIRALDYIISLSQNHDIAAINLSLGTGQFSSVTDCDARSNHQAYRQAVETLRGLNIAVIAATGNNGYTSATNFPACLSNVIAVGSTTKADNISSFSNSATWVDLVAPGSQIMSAKAEGGFEIRSGTSMAAPHVAGAWALLKSRWPTASIEEILAALRNDSQPIIDSRNGLELDRIQLDSAIYAYYHLQPGINFLGINPPSNLVANDIFSLLDFLGDSNTIMELQFFDADNQAYASAFYDNSQPSGINSPIESNQGWITYSSQNRLVTNESHNNCPAINLQPGLNLVGFPCATLDKKSFDILQTLATLTNSASIQGFNTSTGRFDTAMLSESGSAIGNNFLISNANSYLIHVTESVIFSP